MFVPVVLTFACISSRAILFLVCLLQENAGMREKSVETFQLTVQNCFEFFIFMVVPGYFIYDIGIKELVSAMEYISSVIYMTDSHILLFSVFWCACIDAAR
jgi:hypothetical protein